MSAFEPHELLMAASAQGDLVEIAGVQLAPIEYKGARVLTLSMMDAVHQRPKDTARRNFNEHKKRLIEGEDFCKVSADEIRTHKIFPISNKAHEDVILLTETGYSMLVKSFTDDLAWDVQRQLVKSYFAKPAPATKPRRARTALSSSLADARAIDFIGNMVAKVPGARADVVAAIKLRMIEQHTGLPATQFGSALPAEALEKAVKLNPTEIGRRFAPKLSPIRVNTILVDLGLQRKSESGYVLTEAGVAHGEVHPYQAKNKHVGDQIDWYESVVEVVREAARGAGGQLQLIVG
ncbi:ORF6N domain-containing protein [Oxalobacteraceae bacterium OTU3CINTB1]|nr:ORF6N domain-containing protein [Oxalobacteraceae bacterium OTU3CINTB1]